MTSQGRDRVRHAVAGAEGSAGTGRRVRLFPMFQPGADIDLPAGTGPHAGDEQMLEQIFAVNPPPDPWGRAASHLDGAASVPLGAAANRALAEGGPVSLDQLGDRLIVR
jgi:hypothetical protein